MSIPKPLIIVPAIFLVAVLFFATYFTVAPNEVAVVTRFGKIEYVADPGLHFKLPMVESMRYFRTDVQSLTPPQGVNTYTVDNQEVDVVFAAFYRLPVGKVEYIYANVLDYEPRLMSMAIDRLKAEMGKVNVSSVAEKRGELRDAVKTVLSRDAAALGLEITDFQLVDLQYTRSYREAVAAAANQKAGIEAREYERQQAQKQAETAAINAVGQANAVREQARGAADARLLQAEAEAKAIRLQGEAQAAAIEAQARALQANPNLVQLRQAERWNGVLPTWVNDAQPLPIMTVTPPAVPAAPR